jgi:hypothetical protein
MMVGIDGDENDESAEKKKVAAKVAAAVTKISDPRDR